MSKTNQFVHNLGDAKKNIDELKMTVEGLSQSLRDLAQNFVSVMGLSGNQQHPSTAMPQFATSQAQNIAQSKMHQDFIDSVNESGSSFQHPSDTVVPFTNAVQALSKDRNMSQDEALRIGAQAMPHAFSALKQYGEKFAGNEHVQDLVNMARRSADLSTSATMPTVINTPSIMSPNSEFFKIKTHDERLIAEARGQNPFDISDLAGIKQKAQGFNQQQNEYSQLHEKMKTSQDPTQRIVAEKLDALMREQGEHQSKLVQALESIDKAQITKESATDDQTKDVAQKELTVAMRNLADAMRDKTSVEKQLDVIKEKGSGGPPREPTDPGEAMVNKVRPWLTGIGAIGGAAMGAYQAYLTHDIAWKSIEVDAPLRARRSLGNVNQAAWSDIASQSDMTNPDNILKYGADLLTGTQFKSIGLNRNMDVAVKQVQDTMQIEEKKVTNAKVSAWGQIAAGLGGVALGAALGVGTAGVGTIPALAIAAAGGTAVLKGASSLLTANTGSSQTIVDKYDEQGKPIHDVTKAEVLGKQEDKYNINAAMQKAEMDMIGLDTKSYVQQFRRIVDIRQSGVSSIGRAAVGTESDWLRLLPKASTDPNRFVDDTTGSTMASRLELSASEFLGARNQVSGVYGIGGARASESLTSDLIRASRTGLGDMSTLLGASSAINKVSGGFRGADQLTGALGSAASIGFTKSDLSQQFTQSSVQMAALMGGARTDLSSQMLLDYAKANRTWGEIDPRAIQQGLDGASKYQQASSQATGSQGALKMMSIFGTGESFDSSMLAMRIGAPEASMFLATLDKYQGMSDSDRSKEPLPPELRSLMASTGKSDQKSQIESTKRVLNASLKGTRDNTNAILQMGGLDLKERISEIMTQTDPQARTQALDNLMETSTASLRSLTGMDVPEAKAQIFDTMQGMGADSSILGEDQRKEFSKYTRSAYSSYEDPAKQRQKYLNDAMAARGKSRAKNITAETYGDLVSHQGVVDTTGVLSSLGMTSDAFRQLPESDRKKQIKEEMMAAHSKKYGASGQSAADFIQKSLDVKETGSGVQAVRLEDADRVAEVFLQKFHTVLTGKPYTPTAPEVKTNQADVPYSSLDKRNR